MSVHARDANRGLCRLEGFIMLMQRRQEVAFAHLTSLAVWIQKYVPECEAEEASAALSRHDVRCKITSFWDENIDRGGRLAERR
jgi:hypothetical protein